MRAFNMNNLALPLADIVFSIESEEWGDVRSYLDEFDEQIKQSDSSVVEPIKNALEEKSHLVKFTRNTSSGWHYEEL